MSKKYRLSEKKLRKNIVEAMYILSDGLEWHVLGREDDRNPLVMESPEVIADAVLLYLNGQLLPSSEDSSSTTASSSTVF